MPKFNKNRQFNMEQLETRRLMARNTGVDDDPGFEEPTAPSVPEGEAVAVSRWRPESRIPYLGFPIDTPPADGTPNAAGTGNVKTQFYNGTLTLSEDPNQLGSDQRIIISLVNGKLRVASANGQTLIDGQLSKDFDSINHLSINFSGGSDSVTINGVSLQSLNIDLRDPDTGANGDVVHLDGVAVAGGVTIRTGVGQDEVVVANSNFTGDGAAGEIGIYTSETTAQSDADGDSVSLVGVRTASSLKVSTGAGDDKVLIFQSQIGDGFGDDRATIKTGAGADAIDIGYFRDANGNVVLGPTTTIKGYLDVWAHELNESDRDVVRMENLAVTDSIMALLGAGDDVLIMNQAYSKYISVEMGAGADDARLFDLTGTNAVDVLMGEGDDVLEVQGLSAGVATLDGGGGANDSLLRLYDNFVGSAVQRGWETINGVRQQTFEHIGQDWNWEFGVGGLSPAMP